ncbi:TIGR03364 family FAD-dependent oxidoreductase [Roseimaritima ulvae]|uniref:N-methyl-L-tryptophan oxidase n=1 Tax=Roseimaritima ulvae TaxID=980254 RepID=A0A5B9QT58_9BACT|nr:TIGR03364 family FAD-dependent oxidoreductase [Roseimaritima ulvae]QEG41129.1 N-methyl-L-tryptophan oxidase [Roseimaritima ulvae]
MTVDHHDADLIVIGGGVLGAFHAYHALQRGLKVILLERHAAPQGATVRNFGQVVPSGLDQHWQQFGRQSLQIYNTIQAQFDISIRQQGSVYIASDAEELTLIEELHAINAANDYTSQLWTAAECRQRYPQLRSDYCGGGLFFPDELSVNPRMMVHRLHQFLAQQPGFNSHFQTPVCELASAAHGRVQATSTDGRRFTADKALVCCGSEFQMLFPQLFHASDLQAVKLQMLRLKPQSSMQLPGNILTGRSIRRYESFSQCPSWHEIQARQDADDFAAKWGIHILFKQEADGGIILGDSHEYAPASQIDTLDFDIRSDINQCFIDEGRQIFDLASWDIETSWYGVYCQTKNPAGIFTQTIDNHIHIVTGIGGKGMTSSAGFAKQHLEEIYND